MPSTLELESSITDRYQTTVPAPVRKALKLHKRDKLRYLVQADGSVVLTRKAPKESSDPVLGHFLQFLAHDIEAHPGKLKAVDAKWVKRLKSLTQGAKYDIHGRLSPEDE